MTPTSLLWLTYYRRFRIPKCFNTAGFTSEMETTEKCVKSVQSKQRHENNINVIVLVSIINIE